jgi:outer membrane protein assembly factor BamB
LTRREALGACVGASVATAVAGSAPSAPPGTVGRGGDATADWPTFRGPASLSGVAQGPAPSSPKLVWEFEAGGVPASPVIANGRVFVANAEGNLTAIDLTTGKKVWASKFAAGFEAAPSCAASRLFVADLEGTVRCLEPETGQAVWQFATPDGPEIKASVSHGPGVAIVGSYDGVLHAVDVSTGELRWKYEADAQIHGTCAVDGGVAYVAGCDGHFRGFDAATGRLVTDIRFGGYTAASPSIAGGLAVYGTFSNDVVAIDLRNKALAWRYTPKKSFPFYSSAAIASGFAYIGSRDKSLHVLDLKTGALSGTVETRAKVDSSPVVVGDVVFFGSHDGFLRGIDRTSRQTVFSYETSVPIATAPAFSRGRLVVAADDGRILCFA